MALVMAPEVEPHELAQPIAVLLPFILLWWPGSSLVPHFQPLTIWFLLLWI